jgi:hypothetical protein
MIEKAFPANHDPKTSSSPSATSAAPPDSRSPLSSPSPSASASTPPSSPSPTPSSSNPSPSPTGSPKSRPSTPSPAPRTSRADTPRLPRQPTRFPLQNSAFTALAAFAPFTATLGGRPTPRRVPVTLVSGNYTTTAWDGRIARRGRRHCVRNTGVARGPRRPQRCAAGIAPVARCPETSRVVTASYGAATEGSRRPQPNSKPP